MRFDNQPTDAGYFTEEEWVYARKGINDIKKCKILTQDKPGMTVQAIRRECRKIKRMVGNIGIVIIDYLQLNR